jgi:hypothetical protein
MSDETPKKRVRNPHLGCTDTVRVEFTLQALPPDETRERKGRPERSPSLAPVEQPKPADDQPPAA